MSEIGLVDVRKQQSILFLRKIMLQKLFYHHWKCQGVESTTILSSDGDALQAILKREKVKPEWESVFGKTEAKSDAVRTVCNSTTLLGRLK